MTDHRDAATTEEAFEFFWEHQVNSMFKSPFGCSRKSLAELAYYAGAGRGVRELANMQRTGRQVR